MNNKLIHWGEPQMISVHDKLADCVMTRYNRRDFIALDVIIIKFFLGINICE